MPGTGGFHTVSIVRRTGDVLGYARVSTADQDAAGQHDRLGRSLAELLETVEELKLTGEYLWRRTAQRNA